MTKKTKWTLCDVLRLELLAYRHRVAIASGLRRAENTSNQSIATEILASEPSAAGSRSSLLRSWMEKKWALVIADADGLDGVELVIKATRWLILIGFCLGVLINLSWVAFEDSMHVLPVLVTHAILPFLILLLMLSFGNYFGDGANLWAGFRQIINRTLKRSRTFHQTVQAKAEGLEARERKRAPLALALKAYLWGYTKVCRFSLKAHGQSGLTKHFDFDLSAALRTVFSQQSGLLRLWAFLNLQLMVVAYFFGFFTVFIGSLFFKSSAFHWGTTVNSLLSAERIEALVQFISIPWKLILPPPSFDQIVATQLSYGEVPTLATSGWEAWALFLMMAIVCYAILPRVLLCIIQWSRLRMHLNRYTFAELRFAEIVDGMIHSVGIENDGPSGQELAADSQGRSDDYNYSAPNHRGRTCLMIMDANLVGEDQLGKLEGLIASHLQFTAEDSHKFLQLDGSALNSEAFQQKVEGLVAEWKPLSYTDRIVCLVDSGQPPKLNFKTRVQHIRRVIGTEAAILFVLLNEDEAFEVDAKSEILHTWIEAGRKWGDPNFGVEELGWKGHQL